MEAAERMRGPKPESEWNSTGIWYRVEGDPPTYLPVGFSRNLPRTGNEGEGVIDERRSAEKRLFVPYFGANDHSFGVLKGEAKKACQWSPIEPSGPGGFPLLH